MRDYIDAAAFKEMILCADAALQANIQAINDHEYDYAIGTMYIDLISECEKLGDYVVNVVQAKLGA